MDIRTRVSASLRNRSVVGTAVVSVIVVLILLLWPEPTTIPGVETTTAMNMNDNSIAMTEHEGHATMQSPDLHAGHQGFVSTRSSSLELLDASPHHARRTRAMPDLWHGPGPSTSESFSNRRRATPINHIASAARAHENRDGTCRTAVSASHNYVSLARSLMTKLAWPTLRPGYPDG